MATYKVKYKGEVHEIDWAGPNKPTTDDLLKAINDAIIKKDLKSLEPPAQKKLPDIPDPSTYEKGVLSSLWGDVNNPIIGRSALGPVTNAAMAQMEQDYPIAGRLGNFAVDTTLAGSSPLALGLGGTTAASVGLAKAVPRLARALTIPGKVAGAGTAAHGAYNVGTGLYEGNYPKAAFGALETLGGAAGYHQSRLPKLEAPKPILPDLPDPESSLHIPGPSRKFADVTPQQHEIVSELNPLPPLEGNVRTLYGIEPRDVTLPPLSHIPERLHPPSATQQHFENLLPSVMRERIKRAAELGENIDQLPPSIESPRASDVRRTMFGEMPDAVAHDVNTRAATQTRSPELAAAAKEVGAEVTQDAASAMAGKNLAEARIIAEKARNKRNLSQSWNAAFKSIDTELQEMGEGGKKIYRALADRTHQRRRDIQAAINKYKAEGIEVDPKEVEEKITKGIDLEWKERLEEYAKQTPDPERARELIKNQLGTEGVDSSAKLATFNDRVKAIQAATKLQTFALKNLIGGNMNTLLHTPTKIYLKTLKDAVMKSKELGEFEDASGATWNVAKSMVEGWDTDGLIQRMGDTTMKYYGGNWTENVNRKMAAWAGRGYVRQLFEELKSDPTNKFKRNRLEELLLDDADNILKQETLSPRQELLAGGRHAEITQGLAEARRLPEFWNKQWAQLPLVFRKYAFQQSKELKNLVKNDPKKLVKLALLSQASGELIGGIRAGTVGGVKGAIRGDVGKGVEEEFTDRTEYIGRYLKNVPVFGDDISQNYVVNRVIGNVMEGWGLGLMADLMEGMAGGPMSLAKFMLGAPASQFVDVVGSVATGKPEMMGRELLRATPIPYVGGAGLQRGFAPTPWQREQDEESTRRTRNTRTRRTRRQ